MPTPDQKEHSPLRDSNSELFKEYQRQKMRLQSQLAIQEKQRELYRLELQEIEQKQYCLDESDDVVETKQMTDVKPPHQDSNMTQRNNGLYITFII